jgi:hypothetical protein
VWDFTYPELATGFRKAERAADVATVPYQRHHSGPSSDRIKDLRSLESIQKRGRWADFAAVRRYEKHGRLAKAAAATPIGVRCYHDHCVTELEGVVRGQIACPLPPQQ